MLFCFSCVDRVITDTVVSFKISLLTVGVDLCHHPME